MRGGCVSGFVEGAWKVEGTRRVSVGGNVCGVGGGGGGGETHLVRRQYSGHTQRKGARAPPPPFNDGMQMSMLILLMSCSGLKHEEFLTRYMMKT